MRESIGLYRGKRKDGKGWVEGYYIGPIDIIDDHEICNINDSLGPMVEVDPDTIGQWTGLVDKNGVKVFEWDILDAPITANQETFGDRQYYVVGMIDGQFTLSVRYIPTRNWALPEGYQWGYLCKLLNFDERGYRDSDIIVIGNIHDNQELLEATT